MNQLFTILYQQEHGKVPWNCESQIQILGLAVTQLGTAELWPEDDKAFNDHGTSEDTATDTVAYVYDYVELIVIYECV